MAGRPLSAELKANVDGTVSVRVPVANGSAQRRSIRFANAEQGERYRSALLAVWGTDLPLPDPELLQRVRSPHPTPVADSFADAAIAWW